MYCCHIQHLLKLKATQRRIEQLNPDRLLGLIEPHHQILFGGFWPGVGVNFSPETICMEWLSGQRFLAMGQPLYRSTRDTGFRTSLLRSAD
ncbi:hypothetical protein [Scytonema hofmannii]|uniref:hypothetical protein n=1 Tax=Scytonema hofmannii TaxID=34078 RepID=UPI0013147E10|nr:hypothetical protein [Scytonema hofmannii]